MLVLDDDMVAEGVALAASTPAVSSTPVMVRGHGQPGHAEEGLRQVDEWTAATSETTPGRDGAGHADDQRDPQQVLVVMNRFGGQAVLSPEVAVVGGEADQGVLGEAQLVQLVQDHADVLVQHGHHAVHGRDVLGLLFAGAQVGAGAVNAVAVRLLESAEIRGSLAGAQLEVGRLVVELALR